MKIRVWVSTLPLVWALSGCGPTVTIRHEVSPIHLTIDINIKVQEELEKFFAFEKKRDVTEDVKKDSAK